LPRLVQELGIDRDECKIQSDSGQMGGGGGRAPKSTGSIWTLAWPLGSCSALLPRSYISGVMGLAPPTYTWSNLCPFLHFSSSFSSSSTGPCQCPHKTHQLHIWRQVRFFTLPRIKLDARTSTSCPCMLFLFHRVLQISIKCKKMEAKLCSSTSPPRSTPSPLVRANTQKTLAAFKISVSFKSQRWPDLVLGLLIHVVNHVACGDWDVGVPDTREYLRRTHQLHGLEASMNYSHHRQELSLSTEAARVGAIQQ